MSNFVTDPSVPADIRDALFRSPQLKQALYDLRDYVLASSGSTITIGTANGLSLSGTILSLGLASAGVTGAMSGTYATKLDGIAAGATVGVTTLGGAPSGSHSGGGSISSTTLTLSLADGGNPGLFSSTDFTKLAGIATGATAGVTTVGAVSASSTPNALDISGVTITAHYADGGNPGLLSATTQTVGGAKTFSAAGLFSSTLGVTGDFAVATSKFTVAAATGNTAVAGTLGVTSDFAIATSKFTVAAATGNTVVAGLLTASAGVTVTGALTSSTGTMAGTWGGTPTFSGAITMQSTLAVQDNVTLSKHLFMNGATLPSSTDSAYYALWLANEAMYVGDDTNGFRGFTMWANAKRSGSAWAQVNTGRASWNLVLSHDPSQDFFSVSRTAAGGSLASGNVQFRVNNVGLLQVGNTATGSGFNMRRASGTDDGIYLTSTTGADAYLSGGAALSGSSWVAKTATPGLMAWTGGAFGWWGDTGKSIGSTFTPTQVMGLSTAGLLTPTGGISTTTGAFSSTSASSITTAGGFLGKSAQNLAIWKDATPSKAIAIGMNNPANGTATDDIVFSLYNGTAWSERMRLTNPGVLSTGGGTVLDQTNTVSAITNKSFNSITIAAGALSGAFSGAPNFTGAVTFDSTTLVLDPTNHRVGIGTATPLYTLDLLSATGGGFRIRNSSADNGGTLVSTGSDELQMSGAATWDGTNWTAKVSTPGIWGYSNQAFKWFANTGATPGSTFTPTLRMTLSNAGALTVTAGIIATTAAFSSTLSATSAAFSSTLSATTGTFSDTSDNAVVAGGGYLGKAGKQFIIWRDNTPTAAMSVGMNNPANGTVTSDMIFALYNSGAGVWSERMRLTNPGVLQLPSGGSITINSVAVPTISSSDTLSNKTLTNPTINAASLSGTFSGTPTFSGAVTFSSTINATSFNGPASTTAQVQGQVADGASAVGIIFDNVNALPTAGSKIIAIKEGGTERYSFSRSSFIPTTNNGNNLGDSTHAWGNGYVGNLMIGTKIINTANNVALDLAGFFSDGAGAVGVQIRSFNTLTNATAKIATIVNNSTEKAYFDKDGNLGAPGVLSNTTASLKVRGLVANSAGLSGIDFSNATSLTREDNYIARFLSDTSTTVQLGVLSSGIITHSQTLDSITAHAGGGQGSATALTRSHNYITTVATPGDSVVLPTPIRGMEVTVFNLDVNACDVFGTTGVSIDGGAANAAISLAASTSKMFFARTSTDWRSR